MRSRHQAISLHENLNSGDNTIQAAPVERARKREVRGTGYFRDLGTLPTSSPLTMPLMETPWKKWVVLLRNNTDTVSDDTG